MCTMQNHNIPQPFINSGPGCSAGTCGLADRDLALQNMHKKGNRSVLTCIDNACHASLKNAVFVVKPCDLHSSPNSGVEAPAVLLVLDVMVFIEVEDVIQVVMFDVVVWRSKHFQRKLFL